MNEMKQGLGAITAGAMPRSAEKSMGATRQSMEQIMEAARGMSDAQLADVLMGKSMDVPQFVAMSEAMGRKQLRTALQGQQAQQQAQQPTVKDQLLAETAAQAAPPVEQGIGALPAPNMEQMDSMAGGGIVAFAEGDLVGAPGKEWWEYEAAGEIDPAAGSFWNKLGRAFTYSSDVEAMKQRQQQQQQEETADIAALDQALNETPMRTEPTAVDTTGGPPPATTPAPQGAPVANATESVANETPVRSRFEQFAGVNDDLDQTLEQQKEQAQGEFLMQLGASLLSSPTLSEGLGEGIQQALPALASNKRAAAKLQQDARDFNFNVAKAEEAAEMGERELALQHEKLAADKAYQAGILATKGTTGSLTTKDILRAYQENKKAALSAPGMDMRYNNMSDADKAVFDQQIYTQTVRDIQAVTGGGMMTSGGLDLDSVSAQAAEILKGRGRGE